MSLRINRPESNAYGNVMVLGREYPLFTHVPPLEKTSDGYKASELRVLYISELGKAIPMRVSVWDGPGNLATSIFPCGHGYKFDGSDVDPIKRVEKMMGLPDSWLRTQRFGPSGMSLELLTDEFDFVSIGLSRMARERLSIADVEITRPKMSKEAKKVLRGLRVAVIFPGEEPDEEKKKEGRNPEQYEGQPNSFYLREDSYLFFRDFYPAEIGPLKLSNEAIKRALELFKERFGSDPEEGLSIDNLVSNFTGLDVRLPHGEILTQARMRFYLLR